jgi:hypothetical protein
VLTPPRVLDAGARLLTADRSRGSRGALLAEIGSLGARDVRRRWLNVRPAYAPPAPSADRRT